MAVWLTTNSRLWTMNNSIVLFILSIYLGIANGDRTSEKIYIKLNGNMPCFRRLNATHQIGCASLRGGSVGVIQYVDDVYDLTNVLNQTNYPFVIVIKPDFFHKSTLHKMKQSGKVSGVLLIHPENETFVMTDFSPDQVCPNMGYGLYRDEWKDMSCSIHWNQKGSGILYEDWGFPIFLLRDDKEIRDCFNKFNSEASMKAEKWPFCAAELKSNMLAAKDAKTCLRRSQLVTNLQQISFCDPLGDYNIYSTLLPTNKSNPPPKKSVIVLAAKMDAATEFEAVSPGAHSTVTGLVSLLAIAEALSKYKDDFNNNTNVLFVLFNGESFDYIGSSRMAYDIEKQNFPTSLDDNVINQPALFEFDQISHFIELNQLSSLGEFEAIFMHFDPLSNSSSEKISQDNIKLRKELHKYAGRSNLNLKQIPHPQPLPPASFQSFLRAFNMSGVVITDHRTNFTNKFYNSIYDTQFTMNVELGESIPIQNIATLQEQLTKISTTVAGAIYSLATGNDSVTIPINSTRIHELLNCYLENGSCHLFLQAVDAAQAAKLPEEPYPLYVSIDSHPNEITTITLQVLAFLTGEILPNITKEECHANKSDQIFRYLWVKGSAEKDKPFICVKTTANRAKAVSPAFIIDNYDMDSGLYSTWTESVWETTSVRIFLKPSPQWEMTVLFVGIFVCTLSFVVVWFIERNANILFAHSPVGGC